MGKPKTLEKNLFDLTGKKAVVTGAGRGIGKAVALGLANAGADIGLVSRSESELNEVAELVKACGRQTV
ncbi:MAG: SDR family NAD(P)-dependent oxidoreductase, partial [Deltaproteobacteria bacterium]|nr:SDR family NAD(P)-dependent oxidoreductase [Deltaproteobacteria bacterium]